MGKMSMQSFKSRGHSVFGINGRIVSKTGSIFNDLGKFQYLVMPRDGSSRLFASLVDRQKGIGTL